MSDEKKYIMDEKSAKEYKRGIDVLSIPNEWKAQIKLGKITETEYFEKIVPEQRLKRIEKELIDLRKMQEQIDEQRGDINELKKK